MRAKYLLTGFCLFDEARNCGYFRENVLLLCADCHHDIGKKKPE